MKPSDTHFHVNVNADSSDHATEENTGHALQGTDNYVNWFRHTAPYINAHRNRTFVVYISGAGIEHANFDHLIHDINLLNSLGVRLVLVHGSRPQIDAVQEQAGIAPQFFQGIRITPANSMAQITGVVGQQSAKIDAKFSTGLANSPMQGSRIRTVRGNFITAKPMGVKEGIDYAYTGSVRRIDVSGINHQLDAGNLVILSCLGYSPTGEVFNLAAEQIAGKVAQSLRADKLIILGSDNGITNSRGERITELLTKTAQSMVQQHLQQELAWTDLTTHLQVLSQACENGVARGHLLSYETNGALLSELFSRDGSGTMLIQSSYEQIRCANIDDLGGILELIRPLEQQSILLRRSRELLEAEIHRFTVIELDGAIIGCAALYPFVEDAVAEIACFAIDPNYQGKQRGELLLQHLEKLAKETGLQRIFVLTTVTAHWFIENGFVAATLQDLPTGKQALYNYQRQSKAYIKSLN